MTRLQGCLAFERFADKGLGAWDKGPWAWDHPAPTSAFFSWGRYHREGSHTVAQPACDRTILTARHPDNKQPKLAVSFSPALVICCPPANCTPIQRH